MINILIREDLKTNGHCRLTSSSKLRDYASVAVQWGFPKGSIYTAAISELINNKSPFGIYQVTFSNIDFKIRMTLLFWANGIIAYNQKNYFRGTSQCRTDVPLETRIGSLTLLDLSPAFLILGLGLPLSFLCFLLEIIAKRVFKK